MQKLGKRLEDTSQKERDKERDISKYMTSYVLYLRKTDKHWSGETTCCSYMRYENMEVLRALSGGGFFKVE